MNANLAVTIQTHCIGGCDVKCVLCGKNYEQNHVAAELCDPSEFFDRIGDVCSECLDAGPEIAAARTRQHAEALRDVATWLDQLAGEVETVLFENWMTSNDIRRAEIENEKAMAEQGLAADGIDDPLPPPPDTFPKDWDAEWQPKFSELADDWNE